MNTRILIRDFLGFSIKTDTKSKGGPLRTLIDQVDVFPVAGEGLIRSMVPPMSSNGLSKIKLKMVNQLPKYMGMDHTVTVLPSGIMMFACS